MSCGELIVRLLSNDNSVRRQAEATYTHLKSSQPAQLTSDLLSLSSIHSNPDATTRSFAPVLLRRLLETEGLNHLEQSHHLALKAQLLASLSAEPMAHIRRKLGHVIAEIARLEKQWPELLPAIVGLTQQPDAAMQITALDVIATLCEYMGPALRHHCDQFFGLFSSFVANPAVQNLEIKVAAAKAMAAYIILLESAQAMQPFTQLISPFLQIVEVLLRNEDELVAREILSSLVALADTHPEFLHLHLEAIGGAMLLVARQPSFEPETREVALEILLSLCSKAASAVRGTKALLENFIPCVLDLMAELSDNTVQQWMTLFDDSPDDDGEDARITDAGASAMLRVSNSLGGKTLLPVALPLISQALQNSDWGRRHAALYSLGLISEGTNSLLYKEINSFMPAIVASLSDNHPRVRYAALFCIGQWTEDFGNVERGKNFQAKFGNNILPPLIPMIAGRTESVLRSRALAANLICTFCHPQYCKAPYILPYLDALLAALFETLGTCPREVQEQAITAVACVATVVGDAFVQYYDVFMPVAKQVLLQAHGKQYALLRGKAMESVALIGQAVGKDAFLADARVLMDMLLKHHELHMQEDGASVENQYLSQACVRIGSVLKQDFVPYLPVLVPRLIQQALTPPDIVITDLVDEEAQVDDDLGDGVEQVIVDVRGQGKKRVQIQTSSLDEKLLGINMLYQCAMDLEGAFLPYIDQVLSILIPLLKFEYMESVRLVTGFTLAKLLHAAVDGSEPTSKYPQAIFQQVFAPLLNALEDEKELECIVGFTEAIALCLQECKEASDDGYHIGLAINDLTPVVEKLLKSAHAAVQRRLAILSAESEDADIEEDEEANDEDAILQNLIDAMGWCIKQHKERILLLFSHHWLPAIMPYLDPAFPAVIRAQFICTLDDVLEHGGESLLPQLLPHLWNGLEDSHPNVIRASAYGAGVCAQYGGAAFDAHCVATLQRVWNCIQSLEHDQVETEQASARDNCVSALGKFCRFRSKLVDAPMLLQLWLNCLPLQSDILEAQVVHGELIDMVEEMNMDLLGTNYSNLGLVLKKLAAILALNMDEESEPVLEDGMEERIAIVLQQLQVNVPGSTVQSAWSNLSIDEQKVFAIL
ncbi:importin [Thraustotheca clavata]|uniref:Importin n=1 Tax=Thraustotheca clavata TaxID=74557 RepID=A0A1W0AA80_9STRA|nr:importin [Thraustotheca clavata]